MASSPEQLLDMATTRPQWVIGGATELLSSGELTSNDAVTVWRALGMARRVTGDAGGSVDALRRAVEIAEEGGLAEQVVVNSMSLAMSIGGSGDYDEALRLLDRLDTEHELAGRIIFQRATILGMSGRLENAAAEFARALEHLEAADDMPALALTFKNLGLVSHLRGDAHAAIRHSERALEMFTELDNALEIAATGHNLGLAMAAAGDLVGAIDWLNRSLPDLEEIAGPSFEPGRCHTLLAAGLFEEARAEASRLVVRLQDVGLSSEVPEALLLVGEAELLLDHPTKAMAAADDAAAKFSGQGRVAWEAAARLLRLQTGTDVPDRGAIDTLIADLEAAGMAIAVLKARAAGARALTRAGDPIGAAQVLQGRGRPRRLPLAVQIDLDIARVEVLEATGSTAEAARVAAAGMRRLETHQQAVAATDVRAGLGRHATRLAARGLALAVRAEDPRRTWAWIERSQATALTYRSLTPVANAETASLLTELRSLSTANVDAGDEGARLRKVASLEARIADLTRAMPGEGGRDDPRHVLTQALDTLGRQCLVELAAVDDTMWAIVAFGGRARMVSAGSTSQWIAEARQLSSAMRRTLVTGGRGEDLLRRRIAVVRDLVEPLIPTGASRLVVVPSPRTVALPWPVLSPIPVTVAPSTATWLRALERPSDTSAGVAIAGPGLEHSTAEARAVASEYPGGRVLDQVSAAGAVEAAGTATVLHVACHGLLRDDHPLFNSLRMADGELYLYELQRLRSLPSIVVLSSCESGSVSGAGTEMLGMASVLIAAGVRSVIASPWPIPDTIDTVAAMTQLHRRLAARGDPAAAVQDVSASTPGMAYMAFGA